MSVQDLGITIPAFHFNLSAALSIQSTRSVVLLVRTGRLFVSVFTSAKIHPVASGKSSMDD